MVLLFNRIAVSEWGSLSSGWRSNESGEDEKSPLS